MYVELNRFTALYEKMVQMFKKSYILADIFIYICVRECDGLCAFEKVSIDEYGCVKGAMTSRG